MDFSSKKNNFQIELISSLLSLYIMFPYILFSFNKLSGNSSQLYFNIYFFVGIIIIVISYVKLNNFKLYLAKLKIIFSLNTSVFINLLYYIYTDKQKLDQLYSLTIYILLAGAFFYTCDGIGDLLAFMDKIKNANGQPELGDWQGNYYKLQTNSSEILLKENYKYNILKKLLFIYIIGMLLCSYILCSMILLLFNGNAINKYLTLYFSKYSDYAFFIIWYICFALCVLAIRWVFIYCYFGGKIDEIVYNIDALVLDNRYETWHKLICIPDNKILSKNLPAYFTVLSLVILVVFIMIFNIHSFNTHSFNLSFFIQIARFLVAVLFFPIVPALGVLKLSKYLEKKFLNFKFCTFEIKD